MAAQGSLRAVLDDTFTILGAALEDGKPRLAVQEVGRITYIGEGVARLTGLPNAQAEELLLFPGDVLGMVFNLDRDEIGAILFDEEKHISAGDEVTRAGRALDVPVGDALLGRVVDPLGRPLDGLGPVRTIGRRPVEREAALITQRAPVSVPLQTGIKIVDALVPIGRGQRELIVGDRQTGKTAIAVDTIINQRDRDVICIYCAIGQRGSSVVGVINDLRAHSALPYTIVVVATGDVPSGMQFVAPYAATSMGEYFMEQGRDVLIVYDDLTSHARSYREVSLLLWRPPGREAYPGDIFYIHSRLLERSTQLKPELGGGSLTALPVVETEAQNLSAYIPTNLISITDGQIYLSPVLFRKGILPAVDAGRSVSRVGGAAQVPAYRAVVGDLRLSYAQFEELEAFSRFGTRLDDNTRKIIEHGRRTREILQQHQYQLMPAAEQIAVLLAAARGLYDDVPIEMIPEAEKRVRQGIAEHLPALAQAIEAGEALSAEDRERLIAAARAALDRMREELVDADV